MPQRRSDQDTGADTWSGALTWDKEGSVGYCVQAMDGAGNVAHSDNKGPCFEPATDERYIPLILRDG